MEEQLTLRDIPEQEWQKLAERVREAGGRLIVLVHPFFSIGKGAAFKKYSGAIGRILSKSKVPVVILEPYNSITFGMGLLRMSAKNNVLAIPTSQNNPESLLGIRTKKKNGRIAFEWIHDHGHKELLTILAEKVGVKNVLVGGMYVNKRASESVSEYEKRWLTSRGPRPKNGLWHYSRSPYTGACAGSTYEALIKSGKFETVRWIPNAMYDHHLRRPFHSPYTRPPSKPAGKKPARRKIK